LATDPVDPATPSDAVAFVYVPTRPYEPGKSGPVEFELRLQSSGEAALPVYTDEAQLVAVLGSYQPYIRIPVLHLLVQVSQTKTSVVVNPTLNDGAERWSETTLNEWRPNDHGE
jgi:SseB protein N-terminal domain